MATIGCTPLLLLVPRKVMVMNSAAMMLEMSLYVLLCTQARQATQHTGVIKNHARDHQSIAALIAHAS
jgi:hypothetical protein